MPPPLPHLQFRVLTQRFHTTTQYLKAPRPQPATTVRNKANQPWKLGEPGFSIPTDILMSAHKSKVLPFGPAVATNLIHSYMPMMDVAPNERAGHAICAEHKITPYDLSLFALVLLRSVGPTSSPSHLALARHLLATCSALYDPTATIELHRLLAKAPRNKFTLMELPRVVDRLARIAEKGHPGALFRMGELLEAEGTQAKDVKAGECYRRAGEKGVGEAWVRLGRLQLKSGRKGEAEVSFERGKQLGTPQTTWPTLTLITNKPPTDNPRAYYYLAMASPSSLIHETHLLKAAASGVIEAAHNLGVYYQSKSPLNLAFAREWYTLAATEGFAPSQVNLAIMLRDEGKQAAACEWLAKAQGEQGELGVDAERLKREIEAETRGNEAR